MHTCLHTACEYKEEFAGSGKAYLTGLALTDSPASLGTTQIHLSTSFGDSIHVDQNHVVNMSSLHEEEDQVSDLKCEIAALSEQMESLNLLANELIGEPVEDEEDAYL